MCGLGEVIYPLLESHFLILDEDNHSTFFVGLQELLAEVVYKLFSIVTDMELSNQ